MINQVPFVILTGTVGAGKTAVGEAMSDILAEANVPHAFIDRDALCRSWPPRGPFNEEVAVANVAAVWETFRSAGAERLIMAGVVESRAHLDRYRSAVEGAQVILCRICATQPTREARLRSRDTGESLKWHLARTVELDGILDAVALEQHSFVNDGRTAADVAVDVLVTIGWIPKPAGH